jgi:hypothetical protein
MPDLPLEEDERVDDCVSGETNALDGAAAGEKLKLCPLPL